MPISEKSGMTIRTVSKILNDLKRDNALVIIYAIRYCALENIKDDAIIAELKKLKSSELVECHSCRVANCAAAALDLLGIEPYTGDDGQTLDFISTRFFEEEMKKKKNSQNSNSNT